MARTLIISTIGLLVLVTTVSTLIQKTPADGVLQLAYNPTYEFFFFLPSGRPDKEKLTQTVKDAYFERRPGGVCFKPENDWFFCTSGNKIQ